MGKPETSGGASTYIYGLIFVLYAGIAVVLFIYMMNKRYVSISHYVSIMKSARQLLTYCFLPTKNRFHGYYILGKAFQIQKKDVWHKFCNNNKKSIRAPPFQFENLKSLDIKYNVLFAYLLTNIG